MNTNLPSSIAFEGTQLSIIDQQGRPWLSAADLARALGYKDSRSVTRIYQRNQEEFTDEMTLVVNLTTSGNQDPKYDTRIFSPRGCHLIAMFARTDRAKAFRHWVLDVLEGLAAPKPRPEKTRQTLPGGLTLEQQDAVKALVKSRAEGLPRKKQGKAMLKLWSAIKSKFGVSYKEVPAEQFAEVLSLVARVPLEEALPGGEPLDYAHGRRAIDNIRNFAVRSLTGNNRESVLSECDAAEKVLVRGWSEMDEAILHLSVAKSMLKRWQAAR
ncbi:BRO-N domain-containing protein [Methylohalobius crimeensis]|uniref:BRO-N domain-containing protein n=1 Tax=Methylohalobius crimeensis TaxID=244365 RepID=UPI0003B603F4|nr:BRO family protein [Methylohalobius crimeensis]